MNYTYDIYINFQNSFFDFYEWNKNDKIIYIKKIPIFKVSSKTLHNLKNNKIIVDESFIKKIENKTKIVKDKQLKYCAIISDEKDIVGINFTKNGINRQKSSIRIEDQEKIINTTKKQKINTIKYKTIIKNKITFQTRLEKTNENILLKKINNIYKNNKNQIINYIYLECFGKKEKDINKATKKIKKEITKTNDNFYKIVNILKLIN
ncbi:MAG: hypothetical protein IKF82_08275 [Bacilli bacterium]|nr:hypothetical protein [Bacilli bacterium]